MPPEYFQNIFHVDYQEEKRISPKIFFGQEGGLKNIDSLTQFLGCIFIFYTLSVARSWPHPCRHGFAWQCNKYFYNLEHAVPFESAITMKVTRDTCRKLRTKFHRHRGMRISIYFSSGISLSIHFPRPHPGNFVASPEFLIERFSLECWEPHEIDLPNGITVECREL